jgi:hypothetical protein
MLKVRMQRDAFMLDCVCYVSTTARSKGDARHS